MQGDKRMKRIVALVLLLCVTLVGCGKTAPSVEDTNSVESDVESSQDSSSELNHSKEEDKAEVSKPTEALSLREETTGLGLKLSDVVDDWDNKKSEYVDYVSSDDVSLVNPYSYITVRLKGFEDTKNVGAPKYLFYNYSDNYADIDNTQCIAIVGYGGIQISQAITVGDDVETPYDLSEITNLVKQETHEESNGTRILQVFKIDDTHEVTMFGWDKNFGNTAFAYYDIKDKEAVYSYLNDQCIEFPEAFNLNVKAVVVDDYDTTRLWNGGNKFYFIINGKKVVNLDKTDKFSLYIDNYSTVRKISDDTYYISGFEFVYNDYTFRFYGMGRNDYKLSADDSPFHLDTNNPLITLEEESDTYIIYDVNQDAATDFGKELKGRIVYLKNKDIYIHMPEPDKMDDIYELVEWSDDNIFIEDYIK